MSPPATPAQLRQAYRNQEFQNVSMTRGQCPLMQKEVAIFPVRYALDESPEKGSAQGPHPLPANWSGSTLPPLKSRSYTLRQLRDGWVYVWDSSAKTLHEYEVQGEMFIPHTWPDNDDPDQPGAARPYLLYPRDSQLHIAYSPVQWTLRLCELIRSHETQQTQWMRKVDLPAYCTQAHIDHGAPITELGDSVADILAWGETAPTFTSTLLPTQPTSADAPFKPAFEAALVRGRVPAQDTALFVALDDPLALVDDLNMNLIGRLMEQSQFEALHQHTLQSAFAVQNLCGLDVNALIPKTITDPLQRQVYTDDLYMLLDAHDQVERGKDHAPGFESNLAEWAGASIMSAAHQRFIARWGTLPERTAWRTALDEWYARRLWREDVRFDEVQQYLSQTTREALQLQQHIQRSEADLITWLDQLGPHAEAVYHDPCEAGQASLLMETAHALYTALGNAEAGQQWLCAQANTPTRLFGLALFNFNPEIAALIRQVTHNFSTTGSLDALGREGDGTSPALSPTSAGDATSLATRSTEIKAVFDLETVKHSAVYQAMSSVAKAAMNTLIDVANDHARYAWHRLSSALLPAMKQHLALTLAATQVLFSTEIASSTQLTFNPTYQRDFQAWLREVKALHDKIDIARQILSRPGHAHNHRTARHALQNHEAQLKILWLDRPNQITAKASGSTRLGIDPWTINTWLADLGHSEVKAQLKVAGTHAYSVRTHAWINQNLGNALPVLLVGLNLWNLFESANNAANDGRFTAQEWRVMGANAAYTANAIAALWVGPAWSRAGGMTAQVGTKTLKLAKAGYSEWLSEAKAASAGSVKATVAHEFAAASKSLILRTVTWASLGAIAAGLEAWQLSNDIEGATSKEEQSALQWKYRIVWGMAIVSSTQLLGAALGTFYSFAWVMSTPITIIFAVLGIAYLLISMAANHYKREGLRLWLYRCNWGRGTEPKWLGEEGHRKQTYALLETLQRPSVLARALYHGGGSTPRKWLGFWVQIQLPIAVAGEEVTLQPAMIETTFLRSENRLRAMPIGFYEQFLNGNWVDPTQLGQLPNGPGGKPNPADFTYTKTEQHRLWQVWIGTPIDDPILELEINYPPGVLQRGDGRGYIFRVALEWSTSEADRLNTAFSGELKEEDGIVLSQKATQPLKLNIPNWLNK
ncbi:hypothetical protein PsexTeo8_22680 [Pseudomonas extremaustralis]|uniref:T6SS effector BTH_I2691 family protein n=1 Tax=Pseudomonas extremaustralis TaxID=359110 RepID=UPI002AA0DAAA|nr:T6SS effector BTH_I2691 family protein [Pseudomonas extremaustralis]MDY7065819.1 hypothetical protein [Pseudomonas extremaustralis]